MYAHFEQVLSIIYLFYITNANIPSDYSRWFAPRRASPNPCREFAISIYLSTVGFASGRFYFIFFPPYSIPPVPGRELPTLDAYTYIDPSISATTGEVYARDPSAYVYFRIITVIYIYSIYRYYYSRVVVFALSIFSFSDCPVPRVLPIFTGCLGNGSFSPQRHSARSRNLRIPLSRGEKFAASIFRYGRVILTPCVRYTNYSSFSFCSRRIFSFRFHRPFPAVVLLHRYRWELVVVVLVVGVILVEIESHSRNPAAGDSTHITVFPGTLGRHNNT